MNLAGFETVTRRRFAAAALTAAVSVLVLAGPSPGADINYDTFEDATGLQLNRKAKIVDSTLRLTEDVTGQRGSAFTKRKRLRTDRTFSAVFAFGMTSASSPADGLTFVLGSNEATAIGAPGAGLGYEGIKHSFAVAFDTFPTDSVYLLKNGKPNPIGPTDPDPALTGGVFAWVDYDASNQTLFVYTNEFPDKPSTPDIEQQINLSRLGEKIRVGFTAATGGFSARHEVLGLHVDQFD